MATKGYQGTLISNDVEVVGLIHIAIALRRRSTADRKKYAQPLLIQKRATKNREHHSKFIRIRNRTNIRCYDGQWEFQKYFPMIRPRPINDPFRLPVVPRCRVVDGGRLSASDATTRLAGAAVHLRQLKDIILGHHVSLANDV